MNSIKDFFCDITEPRDSNKRHALLDIITIASCAVICGADSREDIEEFGNTKKEWLETFLELPHGTIVGHQGSKRSPTIIMKRLMAIMEGLKPDGTGQPPAQTGLPTRLSGRTSLLLPWCSGNAMWTV
jgi:hypothetical protein